MIETKPMQPDPIDRSLFDPASAEPGPTRAEAELANAVSEILQRSNSVPSWPADERELHRNWVGDFTPRNEAVVALRARKAIALVRDADAAAAADGNRVTITLSKAEVLAVMNDLITAAQLSGGTTGPRSTAGQKFRVATNQILAELPPELQ